MKTVPMTLVDGFYYCDVPDDEPSMFDFCAKGLQRYVDVGDAVHIEMAISTRPHKESYRIVLNCGVYKFDDDLYPEEALPFGDNSPWDVGLDEYLGRTFADAPVLWVSIRA